MAFQKMCVNESEKKARYKNMKNRIRKVIADSKQKEAEKRYNKSEPKIK